MPPWLTKTSDGAIMHVGPDKVTLQGPGDIEIADNAVTSHFVVDKDSQHIFVLTYQAAHESSSERIEAQQALTDTQTFWREWIGHFDRPRCAR